MPTMLCMARFRSAICPINGGASKARLLPYMEGQSLYQFINFKDPRDCFRYCNALPAGNDPGNQVQNFEMCPDDPNAGKIWYIADLVAGHHGCTNYLGVMGTSALATDGILFSGGNVNLAKVTDGSSHTMIMGERGTPDDLYYGWPYCGCGNNIDLTGDGDNLCTTRLGLSYGVPDGNHNWHFWSYHPGQAMFLWADGSQRPLDYQIDFRTFQAMSTRAGAKRFRSPNARWNRLIASYSPAE